MKIERFRLYRSAFPMVTYRLVLADQVMPGDSIMVPENLDRDEVEASLMGDVLRSVLRSSTAGEQTTLYLADGEALRVPAFTPVILEDTPQDGEEIH